MRLRRTAGAAAALTSGFPFSVFRLPSSVFRAVCSMKQAIGREGWRVEENLRLEQDCLEQG